MEDANVLRITAIKFSAQEDREKWAQWYEASYMPMYMSTGNFVKASVW
jgi:hypothetical protein